MKNLFTFIAVMICFSCGTEQAPPPQVNQPPSNGGGNQGGGNGGAVTFAEIQPLLSQYCGACHGSEQFIRDSNVFLRSDAPDMIFTREMPPSPRRLPEEAYQKLIRFRG